MSNEFFCIECRKYHPRSVRVVVNGHRIMCTTCLNNRAKRDLVKSQKSDRGNVEADPEKVRKRRKVEEHQEQMQYEREFGLFSEAEE